MWEDNSLLNSKNQKHFSYFFLCTLWHLNVLVFTFNGLSVLIFMPLVYNNTTWEQSILHMYFLDWIWINFRDKLGLIDGEYISVDGSIVKANANNFHLKKIEEL